METVDSIVVGAGVVGLAIARALATAGRETIVVEAADAIGTETSSRNSEVIHAGIYYPAGSLMARLCVEGRKALYAYCAARGVPHRRSGKLIVAVTAEEAELLAAIRARAAANGADDLEFVDGPAARALEPALETTVAALVSPSTGIVDSHAYMAALRDDAEAAGAAFAFLSPLEAARVVADGFEVAVGGAEPMRLKARRLILAAGLHASDLARRIEGLPARHVPETRYAKGNYFTLSGRAPFSRLIYPVPVPGGLGTHLTLDMAGQARFGPDVEWVETLDYRVDPSRAPAFAAAIRRYWPALPEGALAPGYAGIRPKLSRPGEPARDFLIAGPADHGIAGLSLLFGIESPGLTASLAIAAMVAGQLD